MYHASVEFWMLGLETGLEQAAQTMAAPGPLEIKYHASQEFLIPDFSRVTALVVHPRPDWPSTWQKELAAALDIHPALMAICAPFGKVENALLDHTHVLWPEEPGLDEFTYRFARFLTVLKEQLDAWQQKQYFDTLMDMTPNLVWFKDKNGIHRLVNRSFGEMVGKSLADIAGKDHNYVWNVDPALGLDKVCLESDQEVMDAGHCLQSEETVQAGDREKILTVYKTPLSNPDGSVMGTLGIGLDITQERAYEKDILNQKQVLETIFSAVDCGILVHSEDGKEILNCNDKALSILGYGSVEEMMEAGFSMIADSVVEEDKGSLRKAIASLVHVNDSVNIAYRVGHADGEERHVMGSVKLLEEGGTRFYQRFLLDVTDQVLQEEANARYQQELFQVLSTDYSMVCHYDFLKGTRQFLRMESGIARVMGGPPTGDRQDNAKLKMLIDGTVHEADREALDSLFLSGRLEKELDKEPIYYFNFRTCINGVETYHQLKAVRFSTWDASRKECVVGVRSVDEEIRKEMEQKSLLEQALDQANSASRAKSVFLSNMSHDIRTPMNAIIGFAELALNHKDQPARLDQYLSNIKVSGDLLLSLINDVLDMSSIESGKFVLNAEPCEIGRTMEEVVLLLEHEGKAKGLAVEIDNALSQDGWVLCDRLRLKRILINVISNAVKYTPPGGKVEFRYEMGKERNGTRNCRFWIRDNGIGMSQEFLSHIYELFARERNTTSSGIQGTGLGMAITKSLVDMMGGTIHVTNRQGVGTLFMIEIPMPACRKPGTVETEISPVLKGGHLLLVEDNELNREIATAILEDAGFSLDTAEDGLIALNRMKNAKPGQYDAILMDVQMPVMNGYEATAAIRKLKDPAVANVPIFAMTANAFESDRKLTMQAGMNGHIAKPIKTCELLDVLSNLN